MSIFSRAASRAATRVAGFGRQIKQKIKQKFEYWAQINRAPMVAQQPEISMKSVDAERVDINRDSSEIDSNSQSLAEFLEDSNSQSVEIVAELAADIHQPIPANVLPLTADNVNVSFGNPYEAVAKPVVKHVRQVEPVSKFLSALLEESTPVAPAVVAPAVVKPALVPPSVPVAAYNHLPIEVLLEKGIMPPVPADANKPMSPPPVPANAVASVPMAAVAASGLLGEIQRGVNLRTFAPSEEEVSGNEVNAPSIEANTNVSVLRAGLLEQQKNPESQGNSSAELDGDSDCMSTDVQLAVFDDDAPRVEVQAPAQKSSAINTDVLCLQLANLVGVRHSAESDVSSSDSDSDWTDEEDYAKNEIADEVRLKAYRNQFRKDRAAALENRAQNEEFNAENSASELSEVQKIAQRINNRTR